MIPAHSQETFLPERICPNAVIPEKYNRLRFRPASGKSFRVKKISVEINRADVFSGGWIWANGRERHLRALWLKNLLFRVAARNNRVQR